MKPEYYDLICLIEDAEQSGDSQIIENENNLILLYIPFLLIHILSRLVLCLLIAFVLYVFMMTFFYKLNNSTLEQK